MKARQCLAQGLSCKALGSRCGWDSPGGAPNPPQRRGSGRGEGGPVSCHLSSPPLRSRALEAEVGSVGPGVDVGGALAWPKSERTAVGASWDGGSADRSLPCATSTQPH